jgi:hypothetical protein
VETGQDRYNIKVIKKKRVKRCCGKMILKEKRQRNGCHV